MVYFKSLLIKLHIVTKRYIFLFIFLTAIILQGCNKDSKTDNKTTTSSSGQNSDLIKKDGNVEKVTLAMKPKKGDKFVYKMIAKTTSQENSPLTQDKDITSDQVINYFYSMEVTESSADVSTYKAKYDSINIVSTVKSGDSSLVIKYNSNIKDSIYNKPDFIQYNAIINEDFFLRVSSKGEISDIYGLEKIYTKMFKALGDTLKDSDKNEIKESFGNNAIKSVMQQQFQLFPDTEVVRDSSWTRSYDTQLMIFPVKNNLSYKIKDIQNQNGDNIVVIDATLSIAFDQKEINEKDVKYQISDMDTGGKGTISFNLSRGCIVKKETNTKVDATMKISSKGQSMKSKQNANTYLLVELQK